MVFEKYGVNVYSMFSAFQFFPTCYLFLYVKQIQKIFLLRYGNIVNKFSQGEILQLSVNVSSPCQEAWPNLESDESCKYDVSGIDPLFFICSENY